MRYRTEFIAWFVEVFKDSPTLENPTLEQAFEAGVTHGIALSKPDNTPKEHIVDL